MDMAIAIRTAVIKQNKLHVQAGGGVVADSDPQMEWEETMNKARAIIRAAERWETSRMILMIDNYDSFYFQYCSIYV